MFAEKVETKLVLNVVDENEVEIEVLKRFFLSFHLAATFTNGLQNVQRLR